MDLKDLLDRAINIVLARGLAMEYLDREGSAWDCKGGRISIELGELLGIHGGGGDDKLEVSSSRED